MYPIKQSTAEIILFFAHDENGDAITGLTDGSFTKRISKGSGAWAAMTATISEDENGWYKFTLSTTHSNATGILTIVLTNGGAKQVNLQFRVDAKLIDDLQDITTAQVNTECDTAMTDYGANTIAPDNAGIAAIQSDLDNGTDGLGAIKGAVDAIQVDVDSMGITKNAIFSNFEFPMVLTSDHYTAATAKTVTGEKSIDGGAFAAVSGTIAEVGSGVYQCDLLAVDTNGDVITYKFSATDCDDSIITVTTRA